MVRPPGDERKQLPVAEVKPDSWADSSLENGSVTLTKSQLEQLLEALKLQTNASNGSDKIISCSRDQSQGEKNSVNLFGMHKTQANESLPIIFQGSPVRVPCPLNVLVPPTTCLSVSSPKTDLSPMKVLTRVEQKRLQWEKERAENRDWNPWGKPGAGAPIKKTQVVTPITPQINNQLLMVHPFTGSMPVSLIPSPNTSRIMPNPLLDYPHNQTCIPPVKPVPAVFRSSIAFGNAESEASSTDYYKRQQWLKELEYQREEHRKFEETAPAYQSSDSNWAHYGKDDIDNLSVSVDGHVISNVASDFPKRNYVRGRGFLLDPVAAVEAEKRRTQALQFQEEIRMQMEEKRQRQEEEKERKKQEEEEEERRLSAERAQLQAEFEQEQIRLKQKAEMEEKKQQAVISAMQEAQRQAEKERKTKKIQKLLPLRNEQAGDNKNCSSNETSGKSQGAEEIQPDCTSDPIGDTIVEVETETLLSDKKELGTQTMLGPQKNDDYIIDRVLTPSIDRLRARAGYGRDFGTQTDTNYGKYTTDEADSTERNIPRINWERKKNDVGGYSHRRRSKVDEI